MKEIFAYLSFDGECREAMSFYASCLGAELLLTPFGSVPGEAPKARRDRILHAKLTKGAAALMASDSMPGTTLRQGNNCSVSINCETVQELELLFKALAEKGTVTMAPHEAFWGGRFGMLTDQFGVNWMFNCDKPAKG